MMDDKAKIQIEIVKRLEFTGKTYLNDAERQMIAYRVFGDENRWREIPEGRE